MRSTFCALGFDCWVRVRAWSCFGPPLNFIFSTCHAGPACLTGTTPSSSSSSSSSSASALRLLRPPPPLLLLEPPPADMYMALSSARTAASASSSTASSPVYCMCIQYTIYNIHMCERGDVITYRESND